MGSMNHPSAGSSPRVRCLCVVSATRRSRPTGRCSRRRPSPATAARAPAVLGGSPQIGSSGCPASSASAFTSSTSLKRSSCRIRRRTIERKCSSSSESSSDHVAGVNSALGVVIVPHPRWVPLITALTKNFIGTCELPPRQPDFPDLAPPLSGTRASTRPSEAPPRRSRHLARAVISRVNRLDRVVGGGGSAGISFLPSGPFASEQR